VKLIPDWHGAWRWFSMQIPALNVAFLGTWSVLPAKFQDAIPMGAVVAIAVGLIAAGMLGRLVKQPDVKPKEPA